jgi:hypothetical protein
VTDTLSTSTQLGIEFADIAIHDNQIAPVEFTFFWTGSNRWQGHNHKVGIEQKHSHTVAASSMSSELPAGPLGDFSNDSKEELESV